ncbi:hypothetical protein EV122DRAFT_168825, partial [Schizophyllum commune]
HLSPSGLRLLKSKNMVKGLEIDPKSEIHQCTACIQGKAHVAPFPKSSERKYSEIGEMTYSDLWGPARVRGIRGEKYFISFTDGYT